MTRFGGQNMVRKLRFFGQPTPRMARIPTPLGLICWECGQAFDVHDSGVSYVLKAPACACVAVHRACFVNAAIAAMHEHFSQC